MSARVLVTGSRDWSDAEALHEALDAQLGRWPDMVLVHGGARGADSLAGRWAAGRGVPVEVYRADWDTHGRAAGHIRNGVMVRAGADVCIAAPLGPSRGTRGCMEPARRAGIPVLVVTTKEER